MRATGREMAKAIPEIGFESKAIAVLKALPTNGDMPWEQAVEALHHLDRLLDPSSEELPGLTAVQESISSGVMPRRADLEVLRNELLRIGKSRSPNRSS